MSTVYDAGSAVFASAGRGDAPTPQDGTPATISQVMAALLAALAKHGDVPVHLEGCDCTGMATGAFEWEPPWRGSSGHVLLKRWP
jgi:hypothetical protein